MYSERIIMAARWLGKLMIEGTIESVISLKEKSFIIDVGTIIELFATLVTQ